MWMAGEEKKKPTDVSILDERYYHGFLLEEDFAPMLRFNGQFLVHYTVSAKDGARSYVISVMVDEEKQEKGIKSYAIQYNDEHQWFIEGSSFKNIKELIEYHITSKVSISKTIPNVLLKSGIFRPDWELDRDDICVEEKLGEGEFGEVHKGTLKTAANITISVALKMAQPSDLTTEQINEFMRSARFMRDLDHRNVVHFYGVTTRAITLLLVMELADCRSLDLFLQKNEQTVDKKTEMCVQAACGVEYLHTKLVIHRDLAARNCLYGGGQVKINGFGLAQKGRTYFMEPHTRFPPIRWQAPEGLRSFEYSQKTDVWSYGIMCWEIYSNGQEPYTGLSSGEVFSKVRDDQFRMTLPPCTPPKMVTAITTKCWAENPEDRPSMTGLIHTFRGWIRIPLPRTRPNCRNAQILDEEVLRARARPPCRRLNRMDRIKKTPPVVHEKKERKEHCNVI